jgi:hypothetical protein
VHPIRFFPTVTMPVRADNVTLASHLASCFNVASCFVKLSGVADILSESTEAAAAMMPKEKSWEVLDVELGTATSK